MVRRRERSGSDVISALQSIKLAGRTKIPAPDPTASQGLLFPGRASRNLCSPVRFCYSEQAWTLSPRAAEDAGGLRSTHGGS